MQQELALYLRTCESQEDLSVMPRPAPKLFCPTDVPRGLSYTAHPAQLRDLL